MLSGKCSKYIATIGLVSEGLLFSSHESKGARPAAGPLQIRTISLSPERVILNTESPRRSAVYPTAETRPRVDRLIKRSLIRQEVRYSCV